MLQCTEAQQVSLACLGHHTFQQPETGLILWKKQCRRLFKEVFAAEGKDICTLDIPGALK